METQKIVINCKDYPTKIQLSKTRRKKYYNCKDKKIPKHIIGLEKNSLGFFLKDGERICKNSRSCDTPRFLVINGQGIWNGNIARFSRNKIRESLHTYFKDYIKDLNKLDLTNHHIKLDYEFKNTECLQDLTNHDFIYRKTFEDCLVENDIIPDDKFLYLRGSSQTYSKSDQNEIIITISLVENH